MSDAAPVGTLSTPATGPEPAAAAAPGSSAAPSTETQPVAKPADPAATAPAAPSSPTEPPADPAKPADVKPADPAAKPSEPKDPAPDQPLFSLPDDVKLIDGSKTKFETFLKPLLADGKVSLTPQQLLDHFLEQARDANNLWVKQQQDLDAANAAACKQRFSETQLAEAETGVGFLASFDPEFREAVKVLKNHPSFVNAMRIVGNLLSEDTFEAAGGHREPAKKSRAEVMYPNQK